MPDTADNVARKLLERRRQIAELEHELDAARRERDLLISHASELGLSRRAVADMAGVTVGRVQQIVDAIRAETIER